MHPIPPATLAAYIADQRAIEEILGAQLLWVESPEVDEPRQLEGVEVRPGDELRTRFRLADGSEIWGGYVVRDGVPS